MDVMHSSMKRQNTHHEKNIENYIQSKSPFKDANAFDIMMKKEKSTGMHGFLPSLDEYK